MAECDLPKVETRVRFSVPAPVFFVMKKKEGVVGQKGILQPEYYGIRQPKYYIVEEMIPMIDQPDRSTCEKIFGDNCKNWPRGYIDHIQEVMNIAVFQYREMHRRRPNPFSLSDLLRVVFFSNLSKLCRVGYNIVLTPEQETGPLATLANICDTMSVHIWFDYPMEKDDPWFGAKRNRN